MDETRALYIITEGKMDAAILHTLLVCDKFQKVYQVPAGGFGNLSSVAKTIRLMNSPNESKDKILIAFDADSEDEEVIRNRVGMMRSLTGADYDNRIGVFCFVPDIEGSLFHGFDYKKNDMGPLVEFLKEHADEMRRKNNVIREMLEFIDSVN